MSFRMWFRSWRRAFWRLFKIGNSPYKSEKQREREHEKRMKAKHSRKGKYRVEKKRARRHGGNYKALSAVVGFFATTLSILLLPFGLLHWGYKSAKKRHTTRMTNPNPTPASSRPPKTQQNGTVHPKATEPHSNVTPINPQATDHRTTVAPTTHTSVPKPPAVCYQLETRPKGLRCSDRCFYER